MTKAKPALLAAIVLAILTQSFTPIYTDSRPLPHPHRNFVARNETVYLSFINYASANVTINSVALGDPSYYGTGDYPVASGNIGYSIYDDGNSSGPVYVSVTINGPTEDPSAIRTLYLTDGLSTHCQEINGSGVYTFYNVFLSSYGTVTADVGGCN